MDLVKIENNEIVCDSSLAAKKFGVKHNEFVKRI